MEILCVFLILASITLSEAKCPKDHCVCESSIICSHVEDMEKMKKLMEEIGDNFEEFTLKDTYLPALPELAFSKNSFNQITFKNVELPFLGPPIGKNSPFKGIKKLSVLSFDNVTHLYNWDWSHLSDADKLEHLKIKDSFVLYVDESFSDIHNNLKTIHLNNCGIKWINKKSFQRFRDLTILSLKENQLASFKRAYLHRPADSLQEIDLSHNNLEQIDDDIFTNMENLMTVKLNNNKLVTISDTLKDLPKERLMIKDNPLLCTCNQLWICKEKLKLDSPTCINPNNNRHYKLCSQAKENLECK